MAITEGFVKQLNEQLGKSGLYTSFPLSLLLIVLEKIIDLEFSCPCRVELNAAFTLSIFIGPFLFAFTVMVLLLRPFKNCCKGFKFQGTFQSDETKLDRAKAFLHCLIPPSVWVILVFIDGRYVTCAWTDWNGIYFYDKNIEMQWCKPTNSGRNETELQDLSHKFFGVSQFTGYILASALCSIIFIIVIYYDCCRKGNEQQQMEYQEMGAIQPCIQQKPQPEEP